MNSNCLSVAVAIRCKIYTSSCTCGYGYRYCQSWTWAPTRQCLFILSGFQASITYICMCHLYDLALLCFWALKKIFTLLILLPFEPSPTMLRNNFMLDQFSHILDLSITRQKKKGRKVKLKGILCTKPQPNSTEANVLSQNVGTKPKNINSTFNLILINCWNDNTFPKNLTFKGNKPLKNKAK